jgi:putative nucleotidyltransferase with HDIG domain
VNTAPVQFSSESVRVSEVLAALSFALDLTEGQPMGHSLRSCLIGMRLAERLDLPLQDRRDLYYALLLKDVGCSSNASRVFELFGGDDRAAKQDLRRVDWANYLEAGRYALAHADPGAPWYVRARRVVALARIGPKAADELVETRCTRGAQIVEQLGFGGHVAEAVRALDEHWDGGGKPRGLRAHEIPLLARFLCIAQTIEVFAVLDGPREALEMARARRGKWFDPTLVLACDGLEHELQEWAGMSAGELREAVRESEPGAAALLAGPGALDRIALGFADVVDAKSPFTAAHSYRVSEVALAIAGKLGEDPWRRPVLKRAALLHDIGKLSVPNSILDKPGPLDAGEWETVRLHPYYSMKVLQHIRGFEELANIAGAHHERIDGRGYFQGLAGDQIAREARILATADVFDALSAVRPYRPALARETALGIMERDRGCGLCGDCLDALIEVLNEGGAITRAA